MIPLKVVGLGSGIMSSVWSFLGLLLSLVKAHLIGKDPDAGRDWEQEEKGTTEAEMAGWHHRLD